MILQTVCNGTIAFSFLTIAIALVVFWYKKHQAIDYPSNYILFALFIGLCGLSRAARVVEFFWAGTFRLTLTLDVTTAIFSLFSAIIFLPSARNQSRLKTPQEHYEKLEEFGRSLTSEEDAYKRLDGLIVKHEALKSFLIKDASRTNSEQTIKEVAELDALIQETEAVKRLLGKQCEK